MKIAPNDKKRQRNLSGAWLRFSVFFIFIGLFFPLSRPNLRFASWRQLSPWASLLVASDEKWVVEAPTPTKERIMPMKFPTPCRGGYHPPAKQTPTETNRSIDDKRITLNPCRDRASIFASQMDCPQKQSLTENNPPEILRYVAPRCHS